MRRREFLFTFAATSYLASKGHAYSSFPVKYRELPRHAPLMPFAEPGHDEFPAEKAAMEIEERLRAALIEGCLPLATDCRGGSPAPREYRDIAPGVAEGVFGGEGDIAAGFKQWWESLGKIHSARFYRLPGEIVRYDVRSENEGRLEQRIGTWKQSWSDGSITSFEPAGEILTHADRPWFRDITGYTFLDESSFSEQLTRGVPYWRSRLDPACGIDLYGEQGIAVGDIDGDGRDEVYICQPGGLPNRLYKQDGSGRLRDISDSAGVAMLDDTPSAIFVDLRNAGLQDLVVVRNAGPELFLNDGKGRFTRKPEAFRFATAPQGSFTSVAAIDYDRDGRLDLYFCSYLFYQTEAQYRYPAPYHDAQNGPSNFLFRNRLDEDPGFFEDVTAAAGMNHNNNRYSFAATWCDYNGDGWPDLYVTNDFGRNNLYKNTGGRFEDVAEQAGVVDLGPGMSSAWLDYDGDGLPDLLVSNMWSACGQRIVNDPEFGVVKQDPSLLGAYQGHVKGNSLYHNNGDGTFTYTGGKEGVEIVPWSWSCDGCDFDNDGTPEIYIACGMLTNNSKADLMSFFYRHVVGKSPPRAAVAPAYEDGWNAINQLVRQEYSWAGNESNVFFARRGGRYFDCSWVSGLGRADDSRAFAFTDLDGDGNLDVILKSRLGPQVRVFQNICGRSGNVIVFSLRGTKSNRDAIGARVEVDGQVKWVTAGSAYLSQHTKRLHFGLGDRERAAKVRIHWPSGLVQDLPALAAGFRYGVTEGAEDIRSHPLRPHSDLPDDIPLPIDNGARLQTTWLWEPVPLPETRRGPALFVLHAGEALPELPAPVESLDLRQAPPELVASYAIIRRYLFDYRADLETPFWMLLDSEGRIRKVYGEAPNAATAVADVRGADADSPDPRGLPFQGYFIGRPGRDYYKFGGALLQAGYGEQALPYFEENLRRSPDNAIAHASVGRIHLQGNRLAEARAALEKAVTLNPALPEIWNELGGVEAAAGDYAAAVRHYEKALELGPDLAYALVNAALAYSQVGNSTEAERLYRRALEVDPKDGEVANSLGILVAKQGRTEEARKLFEAAIEIRPDDTSAINNLGILFLKTGQVNDAIAAFQYGIKVAPDDEKMYLNLAGIWVRMGERERARELMLTLQERKPDSALARKALEQLSGQ